MPKVQAPICLMGEKGGGISARGEAEYEPHFLHLKKVGRKSKM